MKQNLQCVWYDEKHKIHDLQQLVDLYILFLLYTFTWGSNNFTISSFIAFKLSGWSIAFVNYFPSSISRTWQFTRNIRISISHFIFPSWSLLIFLTILMQKLFEMKHPDIQYQNTLFILLNRTHSYVYYVILYTAFKVSVWNIL